MLEGFLRVIDESTWQFEESALIWKIKLTDKTFNLEGSYVRERLATDGTQTAITDGTNLKARFEIPGFETTTYREIDVWYNSDFNPEDITALDEIGITLTGNGAEFTIDNLTECKVTFSKPVDSEDSYVIDYENGTTIIAV